MVSAEDWESLVVSHIEYLWRAMKELPGVDHGGMIVNKDGYTVGRIGRFSLNPPWYQEIYAELGRKPGKLELRPYAERHLEEGFWDIGGYIPPIIQRLGG